MPNPLRQNYSYPGLPTNRTNHTNKYTLVLSPIRAIRAIRGHSVSSCPVDIDNFRVCETLGLGERDAMKILPGMRWSWLAIGTVGLLSVVGPVLADDPSAPAQPPPLLPYGVADVIQLSQAQVSDSTILTYIRTSGDSYGLNASQIIYLRQQGVSDAVVGAMLTQPVIPPAVRRDSCQCLRDTSSSPSDSISSRRTISQDFRRI